MCLDGAQPFIKWVVGTVIPGVKQIYHEANDLPFTWPLVLCLHRDNFTLNLVVDMRKLGKTDIIVLSAVGK